MLAASIIREIFYLKLLPAKGEIARIPPFLYATHANPEKKEP